MLKADPKKTEHIRLPRSPSAKACQKGFGRTLRRNSTENYNQYI